MTRGHINSDDGRKNSKDATKNQNQTKLRTRKRNRTSRRKNGRMLSREKGKRAEKGTQRPKKGRNGIKAPTMWWAEGKDIDAAGGREHGRKTEKKLGGN